MIILHVGHFDRKQHYRAMYNCDYKLRNGMTRLGHAVYEFSNRDVARDSTPLHIHALGASKANEKFLKICATIRPDMILIGHADVLTNESLRKARELKPALKIACYNVDPLFASSNFTALQNRVGVVDTLYITTGGKEIQQFARDGTRVFFLPNPVDASLETGRAFEHDTLKHDVIFCTVRSDRENDREAFMLKLKSVVPEANFGLYGMKGVPSVFGATYRELIANAKMAVNISKTCGSVGHSQDHNYLYSSDRIAHIMGNGLLTFIDRSTGLGDLYTNEEVVFFDTVEDLAQQVRFYLNRDTQRKRVAHNGWKKAHSAFNEKLCANYIVETTFAMPLSEQYLWAGM